MSGYLVSLRVVERTHAHHGLVVWIEHSDHDSMDLGVATGSDQAGVRALELVRRVSAGHVRPESVERVHTMSAAEAQEIERMGGRGCAGHRAPVGAGPGFGRGVGRRPAMARGRPHRGPAQAAPPVSTPLTITFARAREQGACPKSYGAVARRVGGVLAYGADTPVPIATVLDACGRGDALWALAAAGHRRVLVEYACDCAERVLPVFESAHPDDRRPHEALRVARLCSRGLASLGTAWAAGDAAAAAGDAATQEEVWWATAAAWWAAAAAAGDAATQEAAWWAAGPAAGAQEREWQDARLHEYLSGKRT